MKVAVGLSGGVDSALAAALLTEQGHEVTGVFMECWNEPGCRTDKDRQDALGVALKLKIPFKVLDFKKDYRERVLNWFYREYKKGRTPNPDIVCNQEIKFGLFLKWAMKNGFDKVATGHYARISTRHAKFPGAHAPIYLLQSIDKKKDQTYFLCLLKQEQLEKVLFPIGHLWKKQVRLEAKKRGLKVWNKKDSSGICFVGHDLSFEEFLKRKIGEHKGKVVNKNGEIVGEHKGVEFYTIGQRHGFNTNSKIKTQNAKPFYVIKKDVKNNRIIVGSKKDLERKEFEVAPHSRGKAGKEFSGFQGIHPEEIGKKQMTLLVRIRHQGKLVSCKIMGKKVKLKEAVLGVAPGQVTAVYQKMEGSDPSVFECLGGGVIVG